MAVVAYCVKCKAKKEMVDPQEGVTKNGRVITKGTCPDCGTKMSLIGGVAKKQNTSRSLETQQSKISQQLLLALYIVFRISPASAGLFLCDRVKNSEFGGTNAESKGDFVRLFRKIYLKLRSRDEENFILNWDNRKHKIIFNRKVTKPNNKALRFLTIRHLDFIMVTVMRST